MKSWQCQIDYQGNDGHDNKEGKDNNQKVLETFPSIGPFVGGLFSTTRRIESRRDETLSQAQDVLRPSIVTVSPGPLFVSSRSGGILLGCIDRLIVIHGNIKAQH